ncbi:TonB-dependent receptor [uncultured Tenacibaculum sp.]|uniref:TonB-dependent receptor n=1 Tax=uncultured Tenacibaculum sp. TaxID=174713 RepID=UPI002622FD01|nr:TonB-dependent receptor [uncultured Tenacibaculum sp.]
MKKQALFICLGLLLPIFNGFSQTIFKGKVVNNQNNPIVGATIVSLINKNKGTITDFEGNFSIKLKEGSVQISSIGYETKKIVLSNNNIIVLNQAIESLEEVIVSASRETQKRQEVSASIGLLTENQIKETKAFGIEQLVNQVPGVFMSTSKASSNEQHFMATRSPISTKSLFLYVEDGLPIRPVAVFNHNALLEMNNTTFGRVEVLKGPASSIYGSEAIGGSFNFITKNPRKDFGGSIGMQINDLGLTKYELEASTTIKEKYGFYVGGHHIRRDNGVVGHSDYEKTAVSFKNVNDFSESLKWTNSFTYIDYRSDMSGSISEKNYTDGNYESNQTFTEREAKAFRFRTTLDKHWNDSNKTSFNFIYRNNKMNQIPSYRIKQNRVSGVLDGTGKGEINSNKFKSYVGLVQHKTDFNFANSSLIIGAITDFSPQNYEAENIDVIVDVVTAQNTNYSVKKGDYILKYQADIFNYAGYAQFEISPLDKVKLTGALRYDGFTYDYDNLDEANSGVQDTKITYTNFSPKLGVNLNLTKRAGIYSNYSKGFTPPQVGTLFRNGKNKTGNAFTLKPAEFHNYEIGAYFTIPSKLKLDLAIYQLDGINRLVSIRDNSGDFIQKNAGKTRSKGIELGMKYNVLNNVYVNYSGSYATHKYLSFFENNIDYSNTNMQTAPKYISTTSLNYKPISDLLLTLEHEQIGKYNTSFEGQAVIGKDNLANDVLGTSTYQGHSIFNFRANYTYKQFEIWGQALNIFNELYAVRASYSRWSKQNTYSIGNPRAFHFGVKYNF